MGEWEDNVHMIMMEDDDDDDDDDEGDEDAEENDRQTFCASLRGRNTCQDFTKTALYRNLQEKCCSPE